MAKRRKKRRTTCKRVRVKGGSRIMCFRGGKIVKAPARRRKRRRKSRR
jgi:hypothetical protein